MKKLIFSICLMLLCVVLFNSRTYASFIYDIDRYTQVGGVLGTSTLVDEFIDGIEPPDGPSGNPTYFTEGTFGSTRESTDPLGELLELNSEDADIDFDEGYMDIGAGLIDITYHFNSGAGGSMAGRFEVNNGFSFNTFIGVSLWNFNQTTYTSSDVNEAWVEIEVDSLGNKYAVWGNDFVGGTQDITADLGAETNITMSLLLDTSNQLTAMWDYGSDGSIDLTKENFLTISFLPGYHYSGEFYASEDFPIPEPTTIALLGIGLAGLAGAALRRRLKKAKQK